MVVRFHPPEPMYFKNMNEDKNMVAVWSLLQDYIKHQTRTEAEKDSSAFAFWNNTAVFLRTLLNVVEFRYLLLPFGTKYCADFIRVERDSGFLVIRFKTFHIFGLRIARLVISSNWIADEKKSAKGAIGPTKDDPVPVGPTGATGTSVPC